MRSIKSRSGGSTAVGHRELERYVQEAIQSAGLVPAHVMGIDQVGTVEAGKRADPIVIAGDPLGNIRNTRNCHLDSGFVRGMRMNDGH